MRGRVVLLGALLACSKHEPERDPAHAPAASGSAAAWHCEPLPFALTTPLAEASAAAWLDGKLVVVGDSGNAGAYAIVDPDGGDTLEQGKLPLGATSDDLEGLAARDGRLYGLTSSGSLYVWRRDGKAFAIADGPYAIGDGDMMCDVKKFNCGKDYEGLCLAPSGSAGACTGFAASKTDGRLYCLAAAGDKLAVVRDRSIAVAGPKRLADCAFDDRGGLWAGGNVFDVDRIYRVEGWQDPSRATVVDVGPVGTGNSEVIAVRGDVVYRMSDMNTAPSLMAKFRCRVEAR